jgi:hypothetical protein
LVLLGSLACPVHAQVECTIHVVQDGSGIAPSGAPVLSYSLTPAPFRLVVRPLACNPSIAQVPHQKALNELQFKPLIWTYPFQRSLVESAEHRDVLLWPANPQIDPKLLQPPLPETFLGQQYRQLCAEFKQCVPVYPADSSRIPFQRDEKNDAWVADFRRLDGIKPLAAGAGRTYAVVLYLVWRELPDQYPMRPPQQLLLVPQLVLFDFAR